MNTKRTSGPIVTGVLPGKDAHEERRRREAQAIEIVQAIQRSPTAPPPAPKSLLPTHLSGNDPDVTSLIYFIYSCGRIKIGYTAELPKRMSQFRTHSPMPPVLLLTIQANEPDELIYHEMFAADRAYGEWFRLSRNLREFLDSKFEPGARALLLEAEYDFVKMTSKGAAFISDVFSSIEKELQNANRSS